jgi:hypothetical protein
MSEALEAWERLGVGNPWREEYVDVRRPQAILAGGYDQAYGHVRKDNPTTVIMASGEWHTYASVEELLADGWEPVKE